MGRGRSKKYGLIFHDPHPRRTTAPTETKHRSTCYTGTGGHIHVSTSFISTETSAADTTHGTDSELPSVLGEEEEMFDVAYMDHLQDISIETGGRRRTAGDEPMRVWLAHREKYLEEMITLEGRGEAPTNVCLKCSESERNPAEFECLDCSNRQLHCQGCIVSQHAISPFHRIRRWNGTFFEKTSLKALGLRMQLGHARGIQCPNPQPSPGDDFTVIDIRAIHSVGLDFCGCGHTSHLHTVQLLRHRLYPATCINPKTATTFRALEAYEILSYASKVSAFEYYQSLARMTDNTGTSPPKDRYPSFLRVIRQWRYLKMMKRAARGHDPDGPVSKTQEGECAVLCPACPQPGKNLPEGWEDAPLDRRWLYGLFLGIDANFRLKRKDVSSDKADPDLGQGFAYFVKENEYKAHLEAYKDEKEPKSTCSRHDAVNLSNSKPGQGHAATGVGTIECARHNMKRPRAVGDLQMGERYVNMDYLFWKSIVGSQILAFFVAYDIACQWSVNLQERMYRLDHKFFLFNGKVYVKFLVPKFHLPAHVALCRTRFSLNLTPGVGRTDGEAAERGWAEVNPLATSTKEMGPGSRRDTLDAHFGDYNWRKVVGMGPTLLRKLKAAASDMADHVVAHAELTSSLPPASTAEWAAEVEAWERDPLQPNPYESRIDLPTQAAVRRRMAEEEAQAIATGRDIALDINVTPSVLISAGLDIEAEQRSIKVESSKVWAHAQDRQKTRLQLRTNALTRKIAIWTQRQQLYMPSVVVLRRADAQTKSLSPAIHEYPLWLPSQVGHRVSFDIRLARIEWELRTAQAEEALDSMRRNLQIRSYLYKFKDRFVRGQHANTRARNAIATVQARIDMSAEEYRAAYVALMQLANLLKVVCPPSLQPLAAGDIREMSEDDGVSEGRRTISWIWRTVGVAGTDENDPAFRDGLRIEWCKSRARAMRFKEEVDLLQEEMERVLRFLNWQERWWRTKAESGPEKEGTPRGEGLRAYAECQAALRRTMASHFDNLWKSVSSYVNDARSRIAAVTATIGGSDVIE